MSLEFLTVSGGSDTIKEHFSSTYGWDGDSPRALLSHRLGHEETIQATNWLLLRSINSPQIPTISLPIATLEPEGNPTKSLQAELGIREPTTLNLGIGALALMDTTAAPNTPLPSFNDYKEATVGTYRSVSSVRTATSKSVIQRMEEFLAGKVAKLRQPLEICPEFVNPVRPTGQSFFFIL